jgi:hypothetical protein
LFAGRKLFAGRNVGRAAGAVGTAHFADHNFGHNGFHGRFPHPYPGFRGWYGYGWYGPVFWPFAYDVLFADLFWGYRAADRHRSMSSVWGEQFCTDAVGQQAH